jgi:hypothetical protein
VKRLHADDKQRDYQSIGRNAVSVSLGLFEILQKRIPPPGLSIAMKCPGPRRHAGRRKMTLSVRIRVRFNAGLRRDTNTATNKWDASSLTVAWSGFPLLYGRSHE